MLSLFTIALLTASSSARCVQTLVPLRLSATNFDFDDANSPNFNSTHPVYGTFKVEATYCPPTTLAGPHANTLIISLPGGTYGPVYWDFGFQPETYSFVRYANARGYATLNVARIGSGLSDHPDPLEVLQTPLQIAAVIQLVNLVRKGALGYAKHRRIVGLGHSLSSYILNGVIVQAPDTLDGVVLTGYSHTLAPLSADIFAKANSLGIPRFANLPDEYITTPDTNTRRSALYGPDGTYDPAVVDFDEAHKDLVSLGEFTTYSHFSQPAPKFRGHVLGANGVYDAGTCGDPACGFSKDEAQAYPAAKSFEFKLVQNSAHDLNLHLIAPEFFKTVVSWLSRHGF